MNLPHWMGSKIKMVGKRQVSRADSVIEDVTRLLERGGMDFDDERLLICFAAIAGPCRARWTMLISLLAPVRSTFTLIASTRSSPAWRSLASRRTVGCRC